MHLAWRSSLHLGRRAGPFLVLALALLIAGLAAGGPLQLQAGAPAGTPSAPGAVFPAVTPAASATAAAVTATTTGTPEAGTYLQASDLAVQYTFPAVNDVAVDSHAL